MIGIHVILEGDGAFSDLAELAEAGRVIHLGNDAPPIQLAALEGGMTSGRTSVMLRFDLPDGRVVLAETSLRVLLLAVRTLVGRYGDQT